MIVEFKVKNFRSIKDEQCLSFVASDEEGQDSNYAQISQGTVNKVLKSNIVYGPNASGKSNLIFALSEMRRLVLSSLTMQEEEFDNLYTPFKLDVLSKNNPTHFEVTIIIDKKIYQYSFSYDSKQIYTEILIINDDEECFNRNNSEWSFSERFKEENKDLYLTWQQATRHNALFLTTAVQLNCHQLKPIYDWFSHKIIIIPAYPIVDPSVFYRIDNPEHKEETLNFLKNADLHIKDIRKIEKNGGYYIEYAHEASDGSIVWFDPKFESRGTQSLLNYGSIFLHAFSTGSLVLVDEIENSLHPLIARHIIQQFHGKNETKAQLWAVTHNTSLLYHEIFRKDQIWFVERNEKQETQIYPLSDFKSVEDEFFERDYLMGRYGALPRVFK